MVAETSIVPLNQPANSGVRYSFFFIFSITAEYALIRHQRKERRYGAALASTYSSGSGGAPADAFGGGDGVVDGGIPHKSSRFGGLFFWRRRGTGRIVRPQYQDPNALPAHTTPDQIRDSYATEETRVGSSASAAAGGVGVYGKYGYQQPLASSSSEQLEMNTYGPPIDNPALRPAGTPLNGDWYAGTSPNSNRYAGTNPYAGRPPPRHYSDGVYDV